MKYEKEHTETGIICPFCKSEDIEGGPVDIEGPVARQVVGCNACEGAWCDTYTLSAVEAVSAPEQIHAHV